MLRQYQYANGSAFTPDSILHERGFASVLPFRLI